MPTDDFALVDTITIDTQIFMLGSGPMGVGVGGEEEQSGPVGRILI